MLAKDAVNIITSKFPDMVVTECLEFPEFYAFVLAVKGREKEDFGGGCHTVNKSDGSLSTFNPTDDLKLLMSAKSIDLRDLH